MKSNSLLGVAGVGLIALYLYGKSRLKKPSVNPESVNFGVDKSEPKDPTEEMPKNNPTVTVPAGSSSNLQNTPIPVESVVQPVVDVSPLHPIEAALTPIQPPIRQQPNQSGKDPLLGSAVNKAPEPIFAGSKQSAQLDVLTPSLPVLDLQPIIPQQSSKVESRGYTQNEYAILVPAVRPQSEAPASIQSFNKMKRYEYKYDGQGNKLWPIPTAWWMAWSESDVPNEWFMPNNSYWEGTGANVNQSHAVNVVSGKWEVSQPTQAIINNSPVEMKDLNLDEMIAGVEGRFAPEIPEIFAENPCSGTGNEENLGGARYPKRQNNGWTVVNPELNKIRNAPNPFVSKKEFGKWYTFLLNAGRPIPKCIAGYYMNQARRGKYVVAFGHKPNTDRAAVEFADDWTIISEQSRTFNGGSVYNLKTGESVNYSPSTQRELPSQPTSTSGGYANYNLSDFTVKSYHLPVDTSKDSQVNVSNSIAALGYINDPDLRSYLARKLTTRDVSHLNGFLFHTMPKMREKFQKEGRGEYAPKWSNWADWQLSDLAWGLKNLNVIFNQTKYWNQETFNKFEELSNG